MSAYGIMMVSFAIDFWPCDVLSSETPVPLLPPEFGVTFAIAANDCDDGMNVIAAFECSSDVDTDFAAVEAVGHGRLATKMHGC